MQLSLFLIEIDAQGQVGASVGSELVWFFQPPIRTNTVILSEAKNLRVRSACGGNGGNPKDASLRSA